jgi:SsrA-binding protein
LASTTFSAGCTKGVGTLGYVFLFQKRQMSKAKATSTNKGASSGAAAKTGKSDKGKDQPFFKTVADNRKARYEYDILETEEAGIQLVGTEVKAIRSGKANLAEAFVRIEDLELWLYSCHISPYDHGNRFNHEPLRKRRLLMHHQQILKLKSKMQEQGLTLIPLKMYFKGNLVKIDLALCKGRKLWDKRDNIAKKESKRGLDRVIKQSMRQS